MNIRQHAIFYALLIAITGVLSFNALPAAADSGHARIVRLSLVQGDVRFTRDPHGDPLSDSKNLWEAAVLNLPVREGYVLATDHGRAVVEFENGAMAFLNENTVVEFYDLSVDNGARTTRLILRQGTAAIYVSAGSGDYFSVTGGDFTAEATARATFRLDNFDDGSSLNVSAGHVSVVRKEHTTGVGKGETFAINAVSGKINVSNAQGSDDFDRWVKARIESTVAATNAGLQYVNNSSYYTSGFGDLYTYGSWYPVSGYGYGWQPFGVGIGWSPFANGGWFMDSAFGWGFIGNQPWGWLPYHFGSWIFETGRGWVWLPGNFGYAGYSTWRPATVSWVHQKGGAVGIVPSHPLDVAGKTSANFARGVYPVSSSGAVGAATLEAASEWKNEKAPARNTLSSSVTAASRPALVSRSMLSGGALVAYDGAKNRFVRAAGPANVPLSATALDLARNTSSARRNTAANLSAARRNDAMPARRPMVPAPSPAQRSGNSGGWGGTSSSGGRAAGPAAPAAGSHPAGNSSGASSGRAH